MEKDEIKDDNQTFCVECGMPTPKHTEWCEIGQNWTPDWINKILNPGMFVKKKKKEDE